MKTDNYTELAKSMSGEEFRKAINQEPEPVPFHHTYRKMSRNEPCHCGSGKKLKNCCVTSEINYEKYNLSNIK